MSDNPFTALYTTALITTLVLLTSGCVDERENGEEILSVIQITGISGASMNGVVTKVTFDLYVNGTTDIEMGSLEMKLNVPASFGRAGADISFIYNGSDPWSGDGVRYAVVEPTRDTSDQLPLMIMGGGPLVLQLDLFSGGIELQTASTLPLEITWGEAEISKFDLYMPTLIPPDGTFRLTYSEL